MAQTPVLRRHVEMCIRCRAGWGHAAKPHLGHAEAGLPPIGQQGQHHAGGGRRGQGHQPQRRKQPQYPSTKVAVTAAQALKHGPALWGGFYPGCGSQGAQACRGSKECTRHRNLLQIRNTLHASQAKQERFALFIVIITPYCTTSPQEAGGFFGFFQIFSFQNQLLG